MESSVLRKHSILKLLSVFVVLFAFGVGLGILGFYIKGNFQKKSEPVVSQTPNISKAVEEETSVVPTDTASNQVLDNQATGNPDNQALDNQVSGTQVSDNQADSTSGNGSFSFAIIGDTKVFNANNPNGNLQRAVTSINKNNPDFAFIMGDIVSSCDGGISCIGKYNDWKKVMGTLLNKTYEVVGNHDRTGGSKADSAWQQEFNLPTNGPSGFSELTYSFNLGNSHFVVLNSEKPKEHLIDSTQQDWLNKDLASNRKDHTFVFFHEPAYGTSQNKKDGLDANPSERDALWNILVKYKVAAVFNGHEHIHTRKKVGNIYQIVVGDTDSTDDDTAKPGLSDYSYKGKSYGIMSINGTKINLKMYTVDGKLLNSFDL